MATGFAPALLKSMKDLAGINYPGTKITAPGFLKMLLQNSDIMGAKLTNEQGHQKTATVKYKQRISPSMVATNDNCDVDFSPAFREASLTAVNTAKWGAHISLDTVSRYMEEASRGVTIGGVSVIQEVADTVTQVANALIGKVDRVLLDAVDWGKNVVYGDDFVHDLNFESDATLFDVGTGFPKLLNDAFENEFSGDLLICGNGIFNAVELSKMASQAALNGIDTSRFTGYKWYADLWSKNSTNWGGNDIGVFSKGSIHFVDFQKYVGFRAGKLGTSVFFQIPIDVDGVTMLFDAQLRELDCPTSIPNIYGTSTSYDRGYVLYLTKTYGLFQVPSDAFATDDRLTGVNGAIHYNVTNS